MTLKTFGEFDNAKGVNYQSAFVQFVVFVFEKRTNAWISHRYLFRTRIARIKRMTLQAIRGIR